MLSSTEPAEVEHVCDWPGLENASEVELLTICQHLLSIILEMEGKESGSRTKNQIILRYNLQETALIAHHNQTTASHRVLTKHLERSGIDTTGQC